ncbi:BglG family transcription antiterminator [Listeria grandensis]|uniref:BglG family transcription antiterminator n=1 Tax=Listeria grandensis TaxID=1494963 RepID=UPI00164E2E32|nr:BglG family transcription antiterminator [Listeria grandensis]MBC6315274.1 transcription antiterminator [Listeria grandensis]
MYISARTRLILEQLLMSHEPVATADLAEYMDVSERTIRRDLKEVEAVLGSYQLALERKDAKLSVFGSDASRQAFKWQLLDLSYNEFTPMERQQFILKTLLKENEPVKLIALANDLNVTISTVSSDLTKLEDELLGRAEIERKRGYGVKLMAEEVTKRALLSDLISKTGSKNSLFQLFQQQKQDEMEMLADERLLHVIDNVLIQKVEANARSWRKDLAYEITDEAYLTLVVHISISVERMISGNYLQEMKPEQEYFRNFPEFTVAKELLAACLEMEPFVVPDGEALYVTMHIRGAKAQDETGIFSGNENVQAVTMAKRLISKVEAELGSSFQEASLLNGLTAHLRPALRRLDQNMRIHNPLIKTIKQDYPSLFQIVRVAFREIYQQTDVPDEEIGYLVLHFGAALLQKNERRVFSGLVVCSSGIGTSKMLATRLKQALPQLKDLHNVSLFEVLNHRNTRYFDVIVSTIDLGKVDFEYFLVSPMLTDREISQIEVFLKQKEMFVPQKAPAEQEEQMTLLEAVHRLEGQQEYANTVLAILKGFQVVPMDETQHDLEDTLRAVCMAMFEQERDIQVEILLRSLLEREKWSGFGIPETRLALFHVRNEFVHQPVFQIFSLQDAVEVPAMGGGNVAATTLLVLLAPEKLASQGLEVMSFISAMAIENEETTQLLESGNGKEITAFVISKLNQFLYDTRRK